MDPTDPRSVRSREALRAAVLELSRESSVESLTVAEVCRRAGITRDTFYRHASSPVALLADALGDALNEAFALERDEFGALRLETGFRHAERTLFAHVAENRAIYRNAMGPQLVSPVRAVLEQTIRELLVAHLHRYPETLPQGLAYDDDLVKELVAAYSAAGTVGSIEVWLSRDPLDIDEGVDMTVKSSPEFWFRSTGEPQ